MQPFEVTILGCGSALPTLRHLGTSQIVNIRNKYFLVDCTEGVQLALRRNRINLNRINTVLISIAGTLGNVLFASYAAYALAKIKFPGRNFLFKIVVYSLMFNSTVTGITNFITMSALGWVDTYWAVIVPAWCYTFGLYLMKQFMETSVNDSVLESARLDGAGENLIFWKIAMPMVKPAWITLIIFAFKDLWNMGANMYIYSEQLKTFNYAISQLVTAGIARSGVSAAATVVMMIVPITVFVITQSNVITTMSTSGMKD